MKFFQQKMARKQHNLSLNLQEKQTMAETF